MSQVSISVITVTHNHAQYIERCLAALVPEVNRIHGEVIVVDNRSDDKSAAIALPFITNLYSTCNPLLQPLSMIRTSDRLFANHAQTKLMPVC
jgi:glycosyltransferase involved in cell wall biosynthesis